MTDIMFITLINYIREHGKGGIIAMSELDTGIDRINIIDTKSKLLECSGFINDDLNKSIYGNTEDNTHLKQFMAQNEYNYTNNLFHKALKFIKDNDYGIYYNTFKIYNSVTKKAVIISDMYDHSIVLSLKTKLFEHFGIYKDDWTQYIRQINNKNMSHEIKQYTKELFENYFIDRASNEHLINFYNKYGIDFDIIYPAYIISIFNYDQNNEDIDNYIADKVRKLNFDKLDYIEKRSKSTVYINTYDRIKAIDSLDNISNLFDYELYELIQNDIYYEEIQTQLYKWYTLSIFDKHKKTKYKDNRQDKKQQNKDLKNYRNKQIVFLKDEGFTQKEVSEMLHISLATIKRYWNC